MFIVDMSGNRCSLQVKHFPRGFSVLDAHRSGLYLATVEDHVAMAEYESAFKAIDAQGCLGGAGSSEGCCEGL